MTAHRGEAAARPGFGAGLLLLTPAGLVILCGLAIPCLLMVLYSLSPHVPGRPLTIGFTLENYGRVFGDLFYLRVILETIEISIYVTAISAVLGYVVAIFLTRTRSRWKWILAYLVFLPLMVGIVVRAYGWVVLLGREGLVNQALLASGAIDRPLRILFTRHAVVIGLVEVMLPFMIMPLVATLEKINPHLEEAARSLGYGPLRTFRAVTFPLSRPGLLSGSLMVFSLSSTAFALPALLGGAKVKMIAGIAYDAMLVGHNWPLGSALGILMTVFSGLIVYTYLRTMAVGRP